MRLGEAKQLDHRAVKWRFERAGDAYAGTITVNLPVSIPKHFGTIQVAIEVKDTFSDAGRAAFVHPYDLPLPDDWPFAWRVEVVPDSQRCRPQPGSLASALSPDIPISVNVNIHVFALFGVEVSAEVTLPGQPPVKLGPLGAWAPFFNVNILVDKLARPESLPPPGTPPHSPSLHPVHPVSLLDGSSDLALVSRFLVSHMRNGVVIQHVATGASLVVRILKPWEAHTGYAYAFNHAPRRRTKGGHLIYDDFLHLRITKDVDIRFLSPSAVTAQTYHPVHDQRVFWDSDEAQAKFADPTVWESLNLSTLYIEPEASGGVPDRPTAEAVAATEEELLRPMAEARFFRVERVDLDELPPFGQPFSIGEADDEAGDAFEQYRKPTPDVVDLGAFATKLGFFTLDISLSFVPVFGDIIDAGEFAWAIVTGCDRTGKPVTRSELLLLGLGLIPIIGLPADVARAGRAIERSF